MSVRQALGPLVRHLRSALEQAGKPDAALDARLIVEHFTGTSRADAVLDPDRHVPEAQAQAILAALERRVAGEPAYRIIGHRDFYGMRLKLSSETLEPRPDTESLVDLALPFVREAAERDGVCRVLDMGTGTGAIALALLGEEPRAFAVATDISLDALATAASNADINGNADRFETLQSSWFERVEGRYHVIVSNPPYIPTKVIETLEREVRDHDPMTALDGGTDGLDAYRAIAAGVSEHLMEDGVVAVEIGYDQPDDVQAIFAGEAFVLVASADDLGGYRRSLAFALAKP
jgi:release factor glutamine methyltransferase